MSALADLGNASGFLYTTDTNGTSVLSSVTNTQDNVRRILEDAGFSNPVAATGEYSPVFGRRYFLNSAGGAAEGVIAGALEITDYVVMKGLQSVFPKDDYTIGSGVLTPTRKSSITLVGVEGEGGASDTLDTITATGYYNGDIIIFKGKVTAHVITFSNNTGNIKLANAANFLTGDLTHGIVLQYNLSDTTWYEITRSPNPTLSVANLRAAGVPTPISGVATTALTVGGGTLELEPGVDKGYQVYTSAAALAITSGWTIQIDPDPAVAYLDGDTMIVDYRATIDVTTHTQSVTIFGITLTAEQALEGRIVFIGTYKLSNTTWYYDVFYSAYGVDVENKAHTAATYEPVLGNPSANGYILSSTTAGVRSWVPNAAAAGNLWEVGSGGGAIQTQGNGADASGVLSIAAGNNAVASGLGSTAVGDAAQATADGSNAFGLGAVASAVTAFAAGNNAVASATAAIALGVTVSASGLESIAIGENCSAIGANSNAIGTGAVSDIASTTNISGAIITKKSSAIFGSDYVLEGASTTITIMTPEIDLKSVADFTNCYIRNKANIYVIT